MRSVDWYRWGLPVRRHLVPFGWDRLGHRHRHLRDRRQPVTGAGACGCAFHHRDRLALANGKANGEVRVELGAMPTVAPSEMERPEETVAVEEIEWVAVIARFASVAAASCAAELVDPSLDHRGPAGAVGRGHLRPLRHPAGRDLVSVLAACTAAGRGTFHPGRSHRRPFAAEV